MLKMNNQFKPIASLEAIKHKQDIRYLKLVNIFSEIQIHMASDENRRLSHKEKNKLRFSLLVKYDIPKFLKDEFGIKAVVKYYSSDVPIAAVATTINNTRAALLDTWRQGLITNTSMKHLYSGAKDDYRKMIALIDRKNVRIGGILSELEQTFHFDVSWVNTDNCTAYEAAAVFFHEIGHVWTFYELAVSETFKNEIMSSIRQMNDPKQKEEFAYVVVPKEYHGDEKMQTLLSSDDALIAVVEDELSNVVRDEISTLVYSERGWEQLADEFAIKMGAGEHLFSVMHMLQEGDPSRVSTPAHLFKETLKAITFGLFMAFPPATAVAAIVLIVRFTVGDKRNSYSDYDPPGKRLLRMRQEQVARLKSKDISREEKKNIIQQVEAMDKALKEYNDHPTFFDLLTTFGGLRGRKVRNTLKEQALLEKLANNDLHLLTSKLEQFGE